MFGKGRWEKGKKKKNLILRDHGLVGGKMLAFSIKNISNR